MLQKAVIFIGVVPCTLLFVVQTWMLVLYTLVSYVGMSNTASLGTVWITNSVRQVDIMQRICFLQGVKEVKDKGKIHARTVHEGPEE